MKARMLTILAAMLLSVTVSAFAADSEKAVSKKAGSEEPYSEQRADRLAQYLQSRLSDRTRTLLGKYRGGRDAELRDALLHDLNGIVLGEPIYDEHRFVEVELRQETLDLASVAARGEEPARANRLLLEDAFPRELARKPDSV